jgi:ribosomal protein L29
MEVLAFLAVFVAGGVMGYGLRDLVTKELLALTGEFKAEVFRIRTELASLSNAVKSKI